MRVRGEGGIRGIGTCCLAEHALPRRHEGKQVHPHVAALLRPQPISRDGFEFGGTKGVGNPGGNCAWQQLSDWSKGRGNPGDAGL